MLTLQCPHCRHEIKANADWSFPPWCPTCGGAVKAAAENVQFYSPLNGVGKEASLPYAADAGYSVPRPVDQEQLRSTQPVNVTLRYFQAMQATVWNDRTREHYRVYPSGTDLLVLRTKGGVDERVQVETIGFVAGGLMYGRMVADQMLEMTPQSRLLTRAEMLDVADEGQLRLYATDGEAGYMVSPEDVAWMRLERASLWRSVLGLTHEAMLTFAHAQLGRVTLALPSFSDARRAMEWLPKRFPGVCQVNL